MQKSLSLIHSPPPRATAMVEGWEVPWEALGYAEDFALGETGAARFDLSFWEVIEIAGRDALDFLQRLSTAGLKQAGPDDALPAAFLTGRGTPVAAGFLLREAPDRFLFVGPPPQGSAAAAHLEAFHFSESLTIRDASGDWALWGVFDRRARLAAPLGAPAKLPARRRARAESNGVSGTWFGDGAVPGLSYWLVPRGDFARAGSELEAAGAAASGLAALEYRRLSAKRAFPGKELRPTQIVLEAEWDDAIHPNKGCYPGQEVVERVRTYGRTQRRLFRFRLEGWPAGTWLESPLPLLASGEAVGELVAAAPSPGGGHPAIGLGYLSNKAQDVNELVLGYNRDVKALVG